MFNSSDKHQGIYKSMFMLGVRDQFPKHMTVSLTLIDLPD